MALNGSKMAELLGKKSKFHMKWLKFDRKMAEKWLETAKMAEKMNFIK
jgi:hypothetical protein